MAGKRVEIPSRAEDNASEGRSSSSHPQLTNHPDPDGNLRNNSGRSEVYSYPLPTDRCTAERSGSNDLLSALTQQHAHQAQLSHTLTAAAASPSLSQEQELVAAKQRHEMLLQQLRIKTHQLGNPGKHGIPIDARYLQSGYTPTNNSLNLATTNVASFPCDGHLRIQEIAAALAETGNNNYPQSIHRKRCLSVNNGNYHATKIDIADRLYKEQVLQGIAWKMGVTDMGIRLAQPSPQNQSFSVDNRHHQNQPNSICNAYDRLVAAAKLVELGQSSLPPSMPDNQSLGYVNRNAQPNVGLLNSAIDLTRDHSGAANHHLGIDSQGLGRTSFRPLNLALNAEGGTNAPANMALNLNTHLIDGVFGGNSLPTASALADCVFDDDTIATRNGGADLSGTQWASVGRYSALLNKSSCPPMEKSSHETTASLGTMERAGKANSVMEFKRQAVAMASKKIEGNSIRITPQSGVKNSAMNSGQLEPFKTGDGMSKAKRDAKKQLQKNNDWNSDKDDKGPKRGERGETNKAQKGKRKRAETEKKKDSAKQSKPSKKQSTESDEEWRPPEVHRPTPRSISKQVSAHMKWSMVTSGANVTGDAAKQSKSSAKPAIKSDEERRLPLPKIYPLTPRDISKQLTFKEISAQMNLPTVANESAATIVSEKQPKSSQQGVAASEQAWRKLHTLTPRSTLKQPSAQMNQTMVANESAATVVSKKQSKSSQQEVAAPEAAWRKLRTLTPRSTLKQPPSQMNQMMVANEPDVTFDASKQSESSKKGVAESEELEEERPSLKVSSPPPPDRLKKSTSKQSTHEPVSAKIHQPSVTFNCPKCMNDWTYTSIRTAHASFKRHTMVCGLRGKETKVKKTPDSQKSKGEMRPERLRSQNVGAEHASSSYAPSTDIGVIEHKALKKPTCKFPRGVNGKFKRDEQIKVQIPIVGQDKKRQIHQRKSRRDSDLASKKSSETDIVTEVSRKGTKMSNMESGAIEGVVKGKKTLLPAKALVARSTLCKVETVSKIIHAQSSYPYAPMGHLWLEKSLSRSKFQGNDAGVGSVNLNAGGTLIGRRWVWDEGTFVDGYLDPKSRRRDRELEISLLKRRCTCGAHHSSTVVNTNKSSKTNNDGKSNGRARRSERSANTYSSIVTTQLANGQLDPHTLICCEEYEMGPEFRFMKNVQTENVQPFLVRVNPDATFLADLHAHLCNSEIIGLLGGHYSNEEKCIYIQASFPCKSTNRTDSGQTDVEMDPIGQIYATEAIANHGMSVVGWYHSHPDFQPNPSITDIENQASYQQLFQAQGDKVAGNSGKSNHCVESVSPFVGLIVGTYDGKNPSSQSVMRWFHCRPKDTAERKSVNFPMNLKTTNRHFRKMTFENKSTADNIRGSMTLHGANIRQVLESSYLSCPITGVKKSDLKYAMKIDAVRQKKQMVKNACEHNGGFAKDTESVVVLSDEANGDKIDNTMSENGHNQAHPNETTEEFSLSMIETGKSPLLLSESLLLGETPESKNMWNFQSARPLYFTENERSILEMEHDDVPDDVFAGIIWFAVEREQQMLPKCYAIEHSLISPGIPASSRSILELLLRQSLTSPNPLHRKFYCIIQCLDLDDTGSATPGDWCDDNDAAIFHNVDVVLGHYAPKHNRINPFLSWSGAGDKGNISKDCTGSSSDPSFFDFYLTKILKMKPVQIDEGQTYRGGIKMKRGHKIAASLLKWARSMQLDSVSNKSEERANFPFDDSQGNGLRFDHERKLCDERKAAAGAISPQHNQYIYFVSEVMRLLAARWRECGTKTAARQGAAKKRGRPLKSLVS